MAAKKKFPSSLPSVKRGRRSLDEKIGGHWRLSVREITEKMDGYEWQSFMVQGWKQDGKWQRRKFKSRHEAEAFRAAKQMELIPGAQPVRLTSTELSQQRIRDAEAAFARLDAIGPLRLPDGTVIEPSLEDAVKNYVLHLKTTHAVERVPIQKALAECLADKEARGVARHRSLLQLKSSVKLFSGWLCRREKYNSQSLDPAWSADVCEVTIDDVAGYLASIRAKDGTAAAPKTRNNSRADLRAFFAWCLSLENDKQMKGVSRRWHTLNPAHEIEREEEASKSPEALSVEAADRLMKGLESDQPEYIPFHALALFAGIRPGEAGELHKLARHPNLLTPCPEAAGRPLIDFARSVITIPGSISKTGKRRVIQMQENLVAWLQRHGTVILPVGFQRGLERIRKDYQLGHDIMRHSFISFRTAIVGKADTALEAGNSEQIIDDHYLHLPIKSEAIQFWKIAPKIE